MDLIEALRNLDPAAIRAALAELGEGGPEDDFALLAGAHKVRLMRLEFTDAERAESRSWLAEHGLRPFQPKVWHSRGARA